MDSGSERIRILPILIIFVRNDRGWDRTDAGAIHAHHVIPIKLKGGYFPSSAAVDSGSELKKCPIFSVLPGMTGGRRANVR
ncbi:hypothetical protein QUF72_21265 [Desulfobacterales bacterium HSG2]|nr:hypothetical protein [Desulfobacterales bacterium HSG2]